MPQSQHPLERRASMLGDRLAQQVTSISGSLQAANGRIPFHTQLPKGPALQWWAQHRYDTFGQQALAGLDPLNVLKLDQALSQYQNQAQEASVPQEAPGRGLVDGGESGI